MSLTEAAVEVDLSVRQLQKYAKLPGCPRQSDGRGGFRYEWPAFNRFVRETLAREAAEAVKPGDIEEARARKMAAEAELAEVELQRIRGSLVEVAHYERSLSRAFGRVRSRLLAIPSRAAPDLIGLDDELAIDRVLDRYVLEVLEELRTDVPDEEAEAA